MLMRKQSVLSRMHIEIQPEKLRPMDKQTTKKAPGVRDISKALHRQKIIDATIYCISHYGISETTVSRVVEKAGLSRGMINLHFNSKNALFTEVLTYLTDTYRVAWDKTQERADSSPIDQLTALMKLDVSHAILNQTTVSVWIAFRSLAQPNPTYTELCTTRASHVVGTYTSLCEKIIAEGGSDYANLHPGSIARGLISMIEGMWIDYMLYPNNFKRESARKTFITFLTALFPAHFPLEKSSQSR